MTFVSASSFCVFKSDDRNNCKSILTALDGLNISPDSQEETDFGNDGAKTIFSGDGVKFF
jgi:hypothetical protein